MTNQESKQVNEETTAEIDGLVVMGGAKRPIVPGDEVEPEPNPATNQPADPPSPLPSDTSDIHIHVTINNPVVHIKTLNIGTFEEEE